MQLDDKLSSTNCDSTESPDSVEIALQWRLSVIKVSGKPRVYSGRMLMCTKERPIRAMLRAGGRGGGEGEVGDAEDEVSAAAADNDITGSVELSAVGAGGSSFLFSRRGGTDLGRFIHILSQALFLHGDCKIR